MAGSLSHFLWRRNQPRIPKVLAKRDTRCNDSRIANFDRPAGADATPLDRTGMCLNSWAFGSSHKRSCLNRDIWHGACGVVSRDSGVGERRMEGLDGWAEAKPPPRCKRRCTAFHLAKASVAADGGTTGILVQRPYGFLPTSCRKPVFPLEHCCATFFIDNSRPAPLTRPGGFGCNTGWVVRRRRVPR